MSLESKEYRLHDYLLLLAVELDHLVGNRFGTELREEFLSRICPDCRAQLDVVMVPSCLMLPPDKKAVAVLLAAADAAKIVPPATPRDSAVLRHRIEYEFNVFAALMLDHCHHGPSTGRDFLHALCERGLQDGIHGFWLRLSQDAYFMRVFARACRNLEGRVAPDDLRDRLTKRCIRENVHTPDEAIPFLEKLVGECGASLNY